MALYIRGSNRALLKSVPFLYKWTHSTTGKWYLGSRTALGCNPDDGYICSSREVKPLIQSNPSEWKREILATGDAVRIRNLEAEMLKQADAKNNLNSFNRHNGDGKFTSTGKVAALSTRIKMSKTRKGIAKSDQHRDAIRTGLKNSTIVQSRRGPSAPRFMGYYISPNEEKFVSSHDAALHAGLSSPTIRSWSKNNKNGWKFQPKEMV